MGLAVVQPAVRPRGAASPIPTARRWRQALATWGPLPGGFTAAFLTLVLANIGATVTPWMIFFQQSAVVDKGLTRADVPQGRMDTAIGALLAADRGDRDAWSRPRRCSPRRSTCRKFANGADFATALAPLIGSTGATLFALGILEAGLVAAMTISTSSSYALAETVARETGAAQPQPRLSPWPAVLRRGDRLDDLSPPRSC